MAGSLGFTRGGVPEDKSILQWLRTVMLWINIHQQMKEEDLDKTAIH